ncbi:MAG TPA: hypothetical protein VJN69_14635 [Candidatus Acidoferrales bacterium]|nr:hypothetical protein [Candidatus Acidoferrales bacterium]
MNPAYGRAMERARTNGKPNMTSLVYYYDNLEREDGSSDIEPERDALESRGIIKNFAQSKKPTVSEQHSQESEGHWVTINGRHVFVHETQGAAKQGRSTLSARDKAYLDKYYRPVADLAKKYRVDPALVLGLGFESGFASAGTYLRTGDAFGMTGGSTRHMTTASSPAENARKLFDLYGNQFTGTGSDSKAFLNAMQGCDSAGGRIAGWRVWNTETLNWKDRAQKGIDLMRRDVPIYAGR